MNTKTLSKIMLPLSLLMIGVIFAAGFPMAEFMGSFRGPDDLPARGFDQAILDWNLGFAPIYLLLLVMALVSVLRLLRRDETAGHDGN